MILIIDNYDSFTYNLVQYIGEIGVEMEVARNDAITIDEIKQIKPDAIVISPGPCTPYEAGISIEVIRQFHKSTPILGVCLGHQAIGVAFGGKVIKAPTIMHGKVSKIYHNNSSIFSGLPNPFKATRYHSLIVDRNTLPDSLEITAWTEDGIIMGLKHKEFPTFGVQFHPESIMTEFGKEILKNFIYRKF
ncbi:anthranilate synthase, component II [Candidatus Kryptobacter tengchongensis]|uniref:Anthranilate synthase, component II n=1 Tax=Kryptobacter tengchongensis TaxID=1643429 RepID=A0A656D5P6_KRYT1|nr:aminodeoxychorismate/anthranilate synthase component II [Candidatus Kryptobacter tengchongensis]CUS77317.1 anthranilate synthase, component II [Candidatus Kryptobacter tengchongensis]CUS96905.1 anthranilate synthase, component II [Candidatus Kryptobacter tengchongensis]CUS98085.1 anthranilate synthase, component II [Candidatus Kryptobacter tengchongensis]CUT00786.1 anthranilate synthase, component II [Candidatus Kryptobacter tengchongensis]CUU05710.1 anthranilate synthase, component II [Can